MRILAILAALTFAIAGGSVALAQHGQHHGGGNDAATMSRCDAEPSMCGEMSACPGHKQMKNGKCDMSKCCGGTMGNDKKCDMMKDHNPSGGAGEMGDMMKDHHGAAGEMPMKDMKCDGMKEMEKMKCCGKANQGRGPAAARKSTAKPSLK